jgi:polysaccharide biosynthesis protein PslH
MRILLLTAQLPYPPQAGGALRMFGLIEGLHRAGHTLDLLAFTDQPSDQPDAAATPLAALCNRIVTVPAPHRTMTARLRDLLFSGKADMSQRYYSARYTETLTELLRGTSYDVVQFESLEMATYLPTVQQWCPSATLIYDSFNAEYDLQRRIATIDGRSPSRLPGAIYSLIQWRRLVYFERSVCQAVHHVIAVSDADADAFRRLSPGVPVSVIPNGIYVAEYEKTAQRLELGTESSLLFTGTMNYRPNVDAILWFTGDVFDTIRQAVSNVRLFIVGNKPAARLDALRGRPDIEITGYVQDVVPFLHSATVYIAPLRMGSGTRLKLLQAMAAGCAIVSTSIGAQGLNVKDEILIADDADSFARAVTLLLKDPARRAELGKAAKRSVCDHYDWSVIIPRLLELYRGIGETRNTQRST